MNITFQSVHFKASDALEELLTKKLTKLSNQNSKIIRADVTLYEGASGNIENNFCEIQLSVKGENHFVKKNSDSYENAIELAIEALQKIMRRIKTKAIITRKKPDKTLQSV